MQKPKQPLSTALKTGGLSTGGLSTGGLAASAPLGGRGSVAGVRLTEETWRLLFPAKQPGN